MPSEDGGSAGICSCSVRGMDKENYTASTRLAKTVLFFHVLPYFLQAERVTSLLNNCFRWMGSLGCPKYHIPIANPLSFLMCFPILSIISRLQSYSNSSSFTIYFMTKSSPSFDLITIKTDMISASHSCMNLSFCFRHHTFQTKYFKKRKIKLGVGQ